MRRLPLRTKAAKLRQTLDFKVRGDTVEPSDQLIGRNVRFLRSENDTIVLRNPSYEAGDTLWVRFDITGYKFGEKNKFDVEYGLTILRANGETMFTQPIAAKETERVVLSAALCPRSAEPWAE